MSFMVMSHVSHINVASHESILNIANHVSHINIMSHVSHKYLVNHMCHQYSKSFKSNIVSNASHINVAIHVSQNCSESYLDNYVRFALLKKEHTICTMHSTYPPGFNTLAMHQSVPCCLCGHRSISIKELLGV